ncbi:MAG: high-potential iron-sulfur protein [Steroidobacteraceae bacterium]
MSHENLSRRNLLKGALLAVAAAPAATLMSREAAAANPLVDPADAQAKGLGYVPVETKVDAKAIPSLKPGQKCDNCIQYTGKPGDAQGGCNLFPGKDVKAGGWCKVWVQKPGSKVG